MSVFKGLRRRCVSRPPIQAKMCSIAAVGWDLLGTVTFFLLGFFFFCIKAEVTEMCTIPCAFHCMVLLMLSVIQKIPVVLEDKCVTALRCLLCSGLNKLKWPPRKWMCGDMFSQHCLLQALAQTLG